MRQLLSLSFLVAIFFPALLMGQQWVDTLYNVQKNANVIYGSSLGFAGEMDTLAMDIYFPSNDTLLNCGRPLLLMIHGGAWFAGDKEEGYAKSISIDFAKRGYVSASINYRLGLFQTEKNINCNVPDWNCWNMTDTAEWYRANFRGIQDAKMALNFLIKNSSTYQIDHNNVFVAGESAGGFIALGVGFIDSTIEVLSSLTDSISSVPKPNAIYENACIIKYDIANSIASMDTLRPDLGTYKGSLSATTQNYTIRGIGNLFGGVSNNIFRTFQKTAPAVYLFSQPCDLLVPYDHGQVLTGYNNCLVSLANCASIINRPFIYGSKGIKDLIDSMKANAIPTTNYFFDSSNNNYNCLQQTNATMNCHALDNYWLRTKNMANFFAQNMDSCRILGLFQFSSISTQLLLFPNPSNQKITIRSNHKLPLAKLSIWNIYGSLIKNIPYYQFNTTIDVESLAKGIYFIKIESTDYPLGDEIKTLKFVKQ